MMTARVAKLFRTLLKRTNKEIFSNEVLSLHDRAIVR